ncbi:hypothetical protein ACVOMV_25510 [Mesorhizobium atlanticum]
MGTIQGPILWWGATRRGPLSFRQLLEVLWPYFVSAIMTSVVEYGLKASLPGTFMKLLLSLVASYVIFLGVVLAFSSSRKGIIELAFEASVMGGRFYRKFAH